MALWLAGCAHEDCAGVQHEIAARDAGARVLRIDDAGMLVEAAAQFAESLAGAVLMDVLLVDEEASSVLAKLKCQSPALQCVVLARTLDPAWLARLFDAGADEVIAVREDTGSRMPRDVQTHARGIAQAHVQEPGPVVVGDAGAGRGTEGLARNAKEADLARPPLDRFDENDDVRELDEPDEPACVNESARARGLKAAAETALAAALEAVPVAAPETATLEPTPQPSPTPPQPPTGPRAPVLCVLAGRGGSGATTLTAAMSSYAAHMGLRAAVVDLDLMFGNLYELLGVEALHDLALLVEPAAAGQLDEASVVRASMRVAPGLTLWGPIAHPERAELMGPAVERLLEVLRRESDVVFVDTSRTWTDAVAAAVGISDRCLVVSTSAVGAVPALERAVNMVSRLGVPRTRMVCVVNRCGPHGCTEEDAMRLEMAAGLSARAHIADGGGDMKALLSFGRIEDVVRARTEFGKSVRTLTRRLLRELGCQLAVDPEDEEGEGGGHHRLRLPWNKVGGA